MNADGGVEHQDRDGLADRLAPVARRVTLPAGSHLALEDAVYFPVDAIATLMLRRDNAQFQIGFAARGDAIGLQKLFAPEFPPISARVLRAGSFICVCPATLSRLMRDDSQLKDRLSAYALRATCRFLDEAARAVALTLERRVARWIARCREAIGSDILPITHRELAASLGVRRSGVTVALHILEGERLIRSRRGRIEVISQAGLTAFSQHRAPSSPPRQRAASDHIALRHGECDAGLGVQRPHGQAG